MLKQNLPLFTVGSVAAHHSDMCFAEYTVCSSGKKFLDTNLFFFFTEFQLSSFKYLPENFRGGASKGLAASKAHKHMEISLFIVKTK